MYACMYAMSVCVGGECLGRLIIEFLSKLCAGTLPNDVKIPPTLDMPFNFVRLIQKKKTAEKNHMASIVNW